MAPKKGRKKKVVAKRPRSWTLAIPIYLIVIVLIVILATLAFYIMNSITIPYEVSSLDTKVKSYVISEPMVRLEPYEVKKTKLIEKAFERLVPVIEEDKGYVDTKTDCREVPYDYTVEYLGNLEEPEWSGNYYTGYRGHVSNKYYEQSIRVCNLESFVYEPLQFYFDVCYMFEDRVLGCSQRRLFMEVPAETCKIYYNLIWETKFDPRKDIKIKVLNVTHKKICNQPLEFSYNEDVLAEQDIPIVRQCFDQEYKYSIDYVGDLKNLKNPEFIDYPERTGYQFSGHDGRYYQYAYVCNLEDWEYGPMIAKFNVCLFYNDEMVSCNSQITMRVPGTGKNNVDPCRPTDQMIYETSFNPGKDLRLVPVSITTKKVCKLVPDYDKGGIFYARVKDTKKVPVTYTERLYRNLTSYRNVTKTYEVPYITSATEYKTLWQDLLERYKEGDIVALRFP